MNPGRVYTASFLGFAPHFVYTFLLIWGQNKKNSWFATRTWLIYTTPSVFSWASKLAACPPFVWLMYFSNPQELRGWSKLRDHGCCSIHKSATDMKHFHLFYQLYSCSFQSFDLYIYINNTKQLHYSNCKFCLYIRTSPPRTAPHFFAAFQAYSNPQMICFSEK